MNPLLEQGVLDFYAAACLFNQVPLLEDQEQKVTALRRAIEEGLNSGIVEDFDPDAYLEEMKARKNGKI